MRLLRLALFILGPAFALSACNTPEVLTPQVDVGGGGQQYAGDASPYGSGGQMADGGAAAGYPPPPAQQSYQPPPQNTLQAQAQALSAGNQPMPQPVQQQALAAPAQSRQPVQPASPAAASGSVRFLPIIGAPVQAVTPLSRQLGAEARARGLTIKGANDAASDYILKGYFSAFGAEGNVTVVYVWDVLDANGGRLHRIQGQDSFPSNAADPWAAVPASLMQQIATKTIAEFLSWKQTQRG